MSAAVKNFWSTRGDSTDNRMAVVGGKNLDAFEKLIKDLTINNGLSEESLQIGGNLTTLPGYYRSTKKWDLVVIHAGRLVAVFEFKSHVGPSFGNNFNNRSEEVLGSSLDLWHAAREGAFGEAPDPYLGYLMLLEDCEKVQQPVKSSSPHFNILPEFEDASYEKRYKLLCEKLVTEKLYQGAAVVMSSREGGPQGDFKEYYLKDFVAGYAAHVAKVASL